MDLFIASVSIVFPVFAVIWIGYLALRLRLIPEQAGDGLSQFVFVIAVPALLFRTLANAELPDSSPWGYWVSYFSAVAIVWGLGGFLARRFFSANKAEAAVLGFAAAQANTVLVGIPLILRAFGDGASVPLVLLLSVHLPLTMTAVTIQVERGLGRSGSLKTILKKLIRHPILVSIAAALLMRMFHFKLPDIADTTFKMLGTAAAPCALFATGMALRRYGIGKSPGLVMIISVLKLLLHPLLVYVLAVHVLAIDPLWAGVAVLFAACPTGINAYLLAQQYRIAHAETSGAIAFTTTVSALTLLLWVGLMVR